MKKIFAISLALLVLAWNLSINFSTHYCGGKAVKSAFLIATTDLDCGMASLVACENDDWDFNEINATPCCANQHSFFQINDSYQNISSLEMSTSALAIVKVFVQQRISVAQSFQKLSIKRISRPYLNRLFLFYFRFLDSDNLNLTFSQITPLMLYVVSHDFFFVHFTISINSIDFKID